MDSYGDLLAYFGVLFGICISFFIYQDGKIREEKRRRYDLRPQFVIDFSSIGDTQGVFTLTIINCGSSPLKTVCLNGDASISYIPSKDYFNIDCRFDAKGLYDFGNRNPTVYIPPDDEGYPSYIQICCTDNEGNIWAFDFGKMKEFEKVQYYPIDFYII